MALDFPSAPTVGQQYAAPNGTTYQWDGAVWLAVLAPLAPGSSVRLSDLFQAGGSIVTLTASELLVANKTITLEADRYVLLGGYARIELLKAGATAATVTLTARLRVGGTTTGLDGTAVNGLGGAYSLSTSPLGRMTVYLPFSFTYLPTAAGATPFKVGAFSNDVTNYTATVPATSGALVTVVQLA